MAAKFHLTVITPEHSFYNDDVEMIVLNASDGEMGIMAGHHPMVVMLAEGLLKIRKDEETWREAAASAGFATIFQDNVLVMLQTAEWPEDIDIRRAERAEQAAREKIRQRKSMQEYQLARAMLARAMARLRVTKRSHND